jgi:ABC-type nitrate/sulfonate/bicarbonate transport system substrate-binding protein
MTDKDIAATSRLNRRTFLGWTAALGATASFGRRAYAQASKTITLLEGTAPPDPISHYFFYARENGFYKQAGIDVVIKPITAETVAMRGLVANEGDVSFVGAVSALKAAGAGAKVKCVSAFAQKLDYLIVGNTKIKNLKDFEGHSFAISQVGAVSQTVPRLMIEKSGADMSKIRWVAVGNSAARLQGLVAKTFDGAAVNTGFASRAERYDYLRVVGDAGEDLPNFLYTWEIGSTHALETKRDALHAFVQATAKGARWGSANPDQAVAISKKILPDLPPEEIEKSIRRYAKNHFWNPTGALSRQTWDYTTKVLLGTGDMKQLIKYEDFVETSFSKA